MIHANAAGTPRRGEPDLRFIERASNNRDAISHERRAADAEHDTRGPELGREGNWDVA